MVVVAVVVGGGGRGGGEPCFVQKHKHRTCRLCLAIHTNDRNTAPRPPPAGLRPPPALLLPLLLLFRLPRFCYNGVSYYVDT